MKPGELKYYNRKGFLGLLGTIGKMAAAGICLCGAYSWWLLFKEDVK